MILLAYNLWKTNRGKCLSVLRVFLGSESACRGMIMYDITSPHRLYGEFIIKRMLLACLFNSCLISCFVTYLERIWLLSSLRSSLHLLVGILLSDWAKSLSKNFFFLHMFGFHAVSISRWTDRESHCVCCPNRNDNIQILWTYQCYFFYFNYS